MTFFDRIFIYMMLGFIMGNSYTTVTKLRDAYWDVYYTRQEVQHMRRDITDMKNALNAVIQVPQEDK